MNEFNKQLQAIFYFSAADLRATRGGQHSPRQQARQRAAGANIRLGIAVFVFVMLGTLGIIAFGSQRTGAASSIRNTLPTLITAAAVVGVVILIGVLVSLKYITPQRDQNIRVVKGIAQVDGRAPIRPTSNLKSVLPGCAL